MRHVLFAAVAVGAVLSAGSAFAADEMFKAALNGASETPPNSSHGVGMATATLNPATKTLTWKVVYSDLTGPATMAHFHGPAGPGVAAPVAVPLSGPMQSPLMGSATLTDAQIGDLEAGNWYVNVHTAQFPKGEIRGQVTRSH